MPKKLDNDRVYPGESGPRPDLAKIKRTEAAERQDAYDKLTIEQKIAALDAKLGVGIGAAHQRTKLTALLEKKNNPATKEVIEMAAEAGAGMTKLINEKKHLKAKDRKRQEQKGNQ
jgi:hypothetical protein